MRGRPCSCGFQATRYDITGKARLDRAVWVRLPGVGDIARRRAGEGGTRGEPARFQPAKRGGSERIMPRHDGRKPEDLRPVKIELGVNVHAEGSCLIEMGRTRVWVTASVDDRVPP